MQLITADQVAVADNPHGVDVRHLYKTKDVVVSQITLEPGEVVKPHKAPVDVFFYVLEGSPTIEIEGQTITAAPGARSPAAPAICTPSATRATHACASSWSRRRTRPPDHRRPDPLRRSCRRPRAPAGSRQVGRPPRGASSRGARARRRAPPLRRRAPSGRSAPGRRSGRGTTRTSRRSAARGPSRNRDVADRVAARREQGVAVVDDPRLHERPPRGREARVSVALGHLRRQLHEAHEVRPSGEPAFVDLAGLQAREVGGRERRVLAVHRVDRRELLAARALDRRRGIVEEARQGRVHSAALAARRTPRGRCPRMGVCRSNSSEPVSPSAAGGTPAACAQQLRESQRVLGERAVGPGGAEPLQPLARVVDARHVRPRHGLDGHAEHGIVYTVRKTQGAQRLFLLGDAVHPAVPLPAAHAAPRAGPARTAGRPRPGPEGARPP